MTLVLIRQLHKTLCQLREAPLKSADRCHLPRPIFQWRGWLSSESYKDNVDHEYTQGVTRFKWNYSKLDQMHLACRTQKWTIAMDLFPGNMSSGHCPPYPWVGEVAWLWGERKRSHWNARKGEEGELLGLCAEKNKLLGLCEEKKQGRHPVPQGLWVQQKA